MQKILPTALALLLFCCLVGCVTTPPVLSEDSSAQTSTQTDVSQSATEQVTAAVSDTTQPSEEQTTYGPLHFPEQETQ